MNLRSNVLENLHVYYFTQCKLTGLGVHVLSASLPLYLVINICALLGSAILESLSLINIYVYYTNV